MHLAIDVRNRMASIGIYDSNGWRVIRKIGVQMDRSSDEYAFFIEKEIEESRNIDSSMPQEHLSWVRESTRSYRDTHEISFQENKEKSISDEIESCWISSVVPRVTDNIAEAVYSLCGIKSSIIGPGIRTGIKIRVDSPAEVGSDLICAAVAARQITPLPCIVIDFGTAITFTAINSHADFIGAAFIPGFETQLESLKRSAAQLPEIKLGFPRKAIGTTTAEAIRSGIILGGMGLIESMIARFSLELNGAEPNSDRMGTEVRYVAVSVVGSGKEIGRKILERLGYHMFRENLVLDGIRLIAEMNEREKQ
ncbi:MAG: type III pantothenate kinase [Rectinema sp.]|nr:type III pantothenate kinase [Rectinema sp.]